MAMVSLKNKELQAEEIRQQLELHGKTQINDLSGRLIIVKVGNNDHPAFPEDIEEMETLVARALFAVDCRVIFTHHAVNIEKV